MSQLRPQLRNGSTYPCITNGTAYLMILKAVSVQQGLVHGRLHEGRQHCAIGSYFDINDRTSLPNALIDEIAAVNDSVPNATRPQRKHYVAKWLRWKLAQLGMPGYAKAKQP